MEQFPFIFTAFFTLLGPLKLIPTFGGLTQGTDIQFKRAVAIRSTAIAFALCAFVAVVGVSMLNKYHITLEGLRLTGGLVLLISALQAVFQKVKPTPPVAGTLSPLRVAVSPVAAPMIVPPAGVGLVLVCMILAPQYPGTPTAVAICLSIIMAMNFLVMYFIDRITGSLGAMAVLSVLGSVMVFVQACLGMQTILNGLTGLGVFQ